MAYESVDRLQNVLMKDVFHYTKDAKKAAGRALGTLVEIMTFYLLKSWGFEDSIGIEKSLAEYGNPEITHNVEYTLHPVTARKEIVLKEYKLPLTSRRIFGALTDENYLARAVMPSTNVLMTGDNVLRNSCVIGKSETTMVLAILDKIVGREMRAHIVEQFCRPYAMFECKRVGIEEGMKKGPQTIEKAKQGAYVAKSVSSLQKVRLASGEQRGLIYIDGSKFYSKPYSALIDEVVSSIDPQLLKDFILTVGVVSNHGNWFTSENHNKELRVLAQSYDWLLFLTDQGLAEFITELLLNPKPLLRPARDAFLASYVTGKKRNVFTKVHIDYKADQVLHAYFADNESRVESWFSVIAPRKTTISLLQLQLAKLRDKEWRTVHSL